MNSVGCVRKSDFRGILVRLWRREAVLLSHCEEAWWVFVLLPWNREFCVKLVKLGFAFSGVSVHPDWLFERREV